MSSMDTNLEEQCNKPSAQVSDQLTDNTIDKDIGMQSLIQTGSSNLTDLSEASPGGFGKGPTEMIKFTSSDNETKVAEGINSADSANTGLYNETKQANSEETCNSVNPLIEIAGEVQASNGIQAPIANNVAAPLVIVEQTDVQASDNVEADGNDEIVITIADDVNISLDQVAQGLAFSQISSTDTGHCFLNNVLNTVLNNSLNTTRQQPEMSSYGIRFNQASSDQYYVPGMNSTSGASYGTHNLHHPSMYSMMGGRFKGEVDRQNCSISSLDQGLHSQMSLDKSDCDSDQDDTKAHHVILDENGDYDSEPLPYHTYSNKDGNIYCYNPENGKFELEIIDEIVTPLTSKRNQQNVNNNPSSENQTSASAKVKKDVVQSVIKDQYMVKLPETAEDRANILGKMSKGDYGENLKVVRVFDDGSIVKITPWFRKYMPKRKSSVKE